MSIMSYPVLCCFVIIALLVIVFLDNQARDDGTITEDLCTLIQNKNNPFFRISKEGRNIYTGPVEAYDILGDTVIFINNQEVKTSSEEHYVYVIFLKEPAINGLSIKEKEFNVNDIEIGDLSLLELNVKKINANLLEKKLETSFNRYKRECKSGNEEKVTEEINEIKRLLNEFKISIRMEQYQQNSTSKVFPIIIVAVVAIIFFPFCVGY
ncbi:uncharacterized protein LOC126890558 [Diabrotica virgifera virgifera]|uniref:Uncharacterized protein n=1 Tax=Diabrotica virgifera virgifera TaxID=50390 RepID=A0ABM5KZD4_DIAVI|nr:uncharacterized protein LOC126890558 [Diabrotica virgifera virgifera]